MPPDPILDATERNIGFLSTPMAVRGIEVNFDSEIPGVEVTHGNQSVTIPVEDLRNVASHLIAMASVLELLGIG